MSSHDRREFGARAERIAAWRLFWRGYRFVERNWRCHRGEVDLIARHRGVLVFIEVKARVSAALVPPEAAVNRDKRRRLCALADVYRQQHDLWDVDTRFDVVAIVMDDRGRVRSFEVFEDAFAYER